jgi:hypothetical protein
MSPFQAGSQCVCIDAQPRADLFNMDLDRLREKAVYTVHAVVLARDVFGRPDEGLLLREIDCDKRAYSACRFRPVQDKKLDVFRKLLAPMPKKKVSV